MRTWKNTQNEKKKVTVNEQENQKTHNKITKGLTNK